MIVYLLTNKTTGQYYVGQTARPLSVRWNEHVTYARQGRDSRLYRALRKYGAEGFWVEVLTETETPSVADEREALWILSLRAYDKSAGYNLSYSGKVHRLGEESRLKLSQKLKGKIPWNKGMRMSESIRATMRRSSLEAHRSGRHKISQNGLSNLRNTKLGKKNPNYGKTGKMSPLYKSDITPEGVLEFRQQGKTLSEIGEHFNCAVNTVWMRLKEARA